MLDRAAHGLTTQPSTKHYSAGTHRVCAPAETVARLRRLMGRVGITRLADVTGLDHIGIPVVQAIRPNARSLSVSQGKGLDLDAATASALGESIELWHAEHIDAELRLASWREMRRVRRVADIEALPRAEQANLHPDLTMLWIEGVDLFDGRAAWVPFDCVNLDGTLRSMPGSGCFQRDSNGLASGNTREEALSHALCEVIERDATSLWNQQTAEEQGATRVDLATVEDAHCREVLAILDAAALDLGVWDMTSDIGLASFAVCLIDKQRSPFRPLGAFGGYGCHVDRAVALSRALTEAVQSRLTRIAGSRDDGHYEAYRLMASGLNDEQHRERLRSPALRPFSDAPSADNPTIDDDLTHQLAQLRRVGLEQAIAVDLSRPDLGVPVVKVLVPGIEGADHSPIYSPGQRSQAQRARRVT